MAPITSFTFDRQKRDDLNNYYGAQKFRMPLITTPDNFDIRWVIGLNSPVFGGPMDPYDPAAQDGYNQRNIMVHLTAGLTHGDMFSGKTAKVVLTSIMNRIPGCNVLDENGNKLIPDRNKPKIQAKIAEGIAYIDTLPANTKLAALFGRNDSEFLEKIVVPALVIRSLAPAVCIPFVRQYINGKPAAVGDFAAIADMTAFSVYFTPPAKKKIPKGQKPLDAPSHVILGDDDNNNRYQCQNNVCVYTNSTLHNCVTLPGGGCSAG